MEKCSVRAVHNMTPVSTGSHKGELAPEGTFMKFSSEGAILSAVYAHDDKLCVRCYSVSDKPTEVTVDTLGDIKEAYTANLLEEKTGETHVDGSKVFVTVAPYNTTTIVIR